MAPRIQPAFDRYQVLQVALMRHREN
jgi:hypothetical protein